jgi:CRISPR-associated protein Cas2
VSFTVIHLEAVPLSVRGTLSRWMLEPSEGTFVGPLPSGVRDEVWGMICLGATEGRVMMAWPSNNEQGFLLRSHGESRRRIRDFDGITLIDFV